MTAEVAVMNKRAVALAADSAVTAQIGDDGNQIYDTVDKLFTISKYHPVGIMIYGSANFMGIPWETIIKSYREQLKDKSFDKVGGYVKNFTSYLENSKNFFPKNLQKKYFRGNAKHLVLELSNVIDKEIDQSSSSGESINKSSIVEEVINNYKEVFESADVLSNFDEESISNISNYYDEIFEDDILPFIEEYGLDDEQASKLKDISIGIIIRDNFPKHKRSGVVIAGFGDKQHFPKTKALDIEGVFGGKLKYKVRDEGDIGHGNPASIMSFAQDEMVKSLMDGIHPDYKETVKGFVENMLHNMPNRVVENADSLNSKQKKEVEEILEKAGANLRLQFDKRIRDHQLERYTAPVLDAVHILPKDKLAALAQSLINLTSFKREFSRDDETVGGPIDVAVISKGDGFIWIERKHYFDPEQNPQFFANYYRDTEGRVKAPTDAESYTDMTATQRGPDSDSE